MATVPNYASTPLMAVGQLTVANTARDGTGTVVTVLTAGTTGCRVADVVIAAAGTTTAGIVRLFLFDGTNTRLLREVAVRAITPSATVVAENIPLTFSNLVLQSGHQLRATTHNAETFNVFAFGGTF
jgi:hypothetical protein